MKTTLPVLTSLLVVSAMPASAQAPVEGYIPKKAGISFTATYFDSADITNLKNANTENTDTPQVTQVDNHLQAPIAVSGDIDSGLWVIQLNLREREFRRQGAENSKQRLYDISVPISYIIKHSDSSRWIFNLSPGVKSSLEYFGNDDLAINAVAQYASSTVGHGYTLGVVYTHAFGEGKFVPLLNYRYSYNRNFEAIVGFPFSRLSYAPNKRQHYFAKLTPEGGSWHVYNDGDKDQTFDFQQRGFRFGLGAEFNAYGPLWLGAEAGVQFGQELELDNEQGESGTLELENSRYLQLTAKFRFR